MPHYVSLPFHALARTTSCIQPKHGLLEEFASVSSQCSITLQFLITFYHGWNVFKLVVIISRKNWLVLFVKSVWSYPLTNMEKLNGNRHFSPFSGNLMVWLSLTAVIPRTGAVAAANVNLRQPIVSSRYSFWLHNRRYIIELNEARRNLSPSPSSMTSPSDSRIIATR